MKSYILLGVIALLAMVFAVPVMAEVIPTPADATVVVSGAVAAPVCEPSLSISTEFGGVGGPLALNFGTMNIDDNLLENAGNLHIQSKCTGWTVAKPVTDGVMKDVNEPLLTPLYQKDVNEVGQPFESLSPLDADAWEGFSGISTPNLWDFAYPLSYKQTVLSTDEPGNYSISLTYTVSST